ncbi:MAG: hypothetical protein LBH15_02960, partial [Treponema sp.]|nr:hypothetical protein [Treponema sp.]
MMRLLFSLRYQAQLRRTRPELYSSLEKSITGILRASGGTAGVERWYIAASFDDSAIGFWLDILVFFESMRNILDSAEPELYGSICLAGRDLDEDDLRLMRSLPSGGTGIWCDPSVRRSLLPYALFDNSFGETSGAPPDGRYSRIKSFRSFPGRETEKVFPYRERICKILSQGARKNPVLAGPRFIGKRDGLRFYCGSLLKGLPQLRIVFGAG